MTKEEALEKNGFSFEWFKFDNEHSAKNLLAAMDEYASLKAEEAFNAARERIELPEGVKMPYKKIFKTPEKYPDYQTFKNQKP